MSLSCRDRFKYHFEFSRHHHTSRVEKFIMKKKTKTDSKTKQETKIKHNKLKINQEPMMSLIIL